VRRHCQLAPAPDVIGDRASRSPLSPGDPGCGLCAGGRPQSSEPSVLRAALCLLAASDRLQITSTRGRRSGSVCGMHCRAAVRLAESYVATGGYMRSDPALAVSDTIVGMIPALITRGGVGFRLDLFPERHGFTVMVGSGRPLRRGHCSAATIRRHIRGSSRNTFASRRICGRSRARCAACAT
jgi:hypothetical protein